MEQSVWINLFLKEIEAWWDAMTVQRMFVGEKRDEYNDNVQKIDDDEEELQW